MEHSDYRIMTGYHAQRRGLTTIKTQRDILITGS